MNMTVIIPILSAAFVVTVLGLAWALLRGSDNDWDNEKF